MINYDKKYAYLYAIKYGNTLILISDQFNICQ